MRLLTAAWFRLRAIVQRKQLNAEFEEELRSHIAYETRANVKRGLSPIAAHQLALAQFGGIERFKDDLRDVRSIGWMQDVFSDMGFGVRRLRHNALYSAAVVGTLALAIGATSTIFTIVHGVLLRPLPYEHADRIVAIAEVKNGQGTSVGRLNYSSWRDALQQFDDIASYNLSSVVLTGAGEPLHIHGVLTSASFFRVLGASAALGRVYDTDAEEPGADKLVVLSDALWRSNFGADPAAIGRSVMMDGVSRTVVAIMQPGFDFPTKSQYWIPLPKMVPGVRTRPYVYALGLLSPGANKRTAQAYLQRAVSANDLSLPIAQRGHAVQLEMLHDSLFGSVQKPLGLLFGAVCLLLLVGSGNIAGLTMAQGIQRRREFAVRLALGASRWRLVRQLLVEGTVLAFAGGVLGTLVPFVFVPVIVRLSPTSVADVPNIHVDTGVLLFIAAVTVSVLFIAALLPAISAARNAPAESLSSAGARLTGSRRHHTAQSALVIGQICAALILVTGAGLLTRSFSNAMSVEPGFTPSHVSTAIVQLPMSRYGTSAQVRSFYERMARQVRGLPGVSDVSLSDALPLFNYQYSTGLKRAPDDGSKSEVAVSQVDAHYKSVLGLRLLRGRFIDSTDNIGARRVAVLTESAARALFPSVDALGREVNAAFSADSAKPIVIGIVADVAQSSLEKKPLPELFLSIAQMDAWPAFMTVRTSLSQNSFQRSLTQIIHAIDPLQPLTRLESLDSRLDDLFAPRRFNALLIDSFALLALVLSLVGLYALMTQGVVSRTREFGIRMALGAQQSGVLLMVLRRGLQLAGAGIVLGLALSFALARTLSSQLFGVTPSEPLVYGAAACSLAIMAAAACYMPARRATSISPVSALRQD